MAADGPERARPRPFRVRFLANPSYVVHFAKLVAAGSSGHPLVMRDGRVVSAREVLWRLARQSTLAQPVASLLILASTPWYLVSQVIGRFLLAKESRDDPFVGFGCGKGSGGLVYWLTLVNKSRRYGSLGLAHDTYFGMPLGVHTWPGATAVLRLVRYRGLIAVSAALLSAAVGTAAARAGHPLLGLTIPLLLCSCYFAFNVYLGVFETLAWGLAALAIVAAWSHIGVVAGLLLGATLVVHPGVALLAGSVVGIGVAGRADARELVEIVVAGALSCGWFLVPYVRSRDKLGRGTIINEEFGGTQLRWTRANVYQGLVYSALLGAAASTGAFGVDAMLQLALPLVVLLVNARIRWVFSEYTVTNFMLVLGGLYAVESASPLVWLAYLAVVYTPPTVLVGSACGFGKGFDLTPVRFGVTGTRIREAFLGLQAGRVAFEHDVFGSEISYATAALTYLLSDLPVDLLNAGYAEIGDSSIFERYVRPLSAGSEPAALEHACRSAGVTHLVVFSPALASTLEVRGLRRVVTLTKLELSPRVGAAVLELAIFDLGSSPDTSPGQLTIVPNRVTFPAHAGREYALRLTAFPGWRAYQHRTRLEILDARPGMRVIVPGDGEVTLVYRYRHYFTP